HRIGSSIGGDEPFGAGSRKWLNPHIAAAGFVGDIGEPLAVRRKSRQAFVESRQQKRHRIAAGRDHPNVASTAWLSLVEGDRGPILRPGGWKLRAGAGQGWQGAR